jgi:hypothetical protein
MAANTKNKYPADKTGSKYSEFRNTKRVSPGKVQKDVKQTGGSADPTSDKTT